MAAVQEVVEAGDVGRVDRRPRIARLLEVEDARRGERFEEVYSRYLYTMRPRVRSYGDSSTRMRSPGVMRMK